jgi:hypothetical protein
VKYDGWRCLAFSGGIRLVSRNRDSEAGTVQSLLPVRTSYIQKHPAIASIQGVKHIFSALLLIAADEALSTPENRLKR